MERTENSRAMRRIENVPATTAASANLNPTSPVASLRRLSPLRIVVRRAGTRRRSVTALTDTASVGETMAPRASAIASGRPGTSQCATSPTVSVVNATSPIARRRMGRLARISSRRGMSQPSENRSGGRKQRKKNPGSRSNLGKPGRNAAPAPPNRYVMSCGHGSQRPTTLRLATSRSRRRACSKGIKRCQFLGGGRADSDRGFALGPALLALPVPCYPDADLVENVERDRHRDLGDHLGGRQHRAQDEREDRDVAPVLGEVRVREDPDLHQEEDNQGELEPEPHAENELADKVDVLVRPPVLP